MKENNSITAEEKLFCRVYTFFYGEKIDKPKQLVKHFFDDVDEFIDFCEAYHTAKQMSKEQTPITEEELYISIADILGRHWGIDVENTKKCVEIAEQYAQAKVLEALEPQKELIEELLTIFDGYGVPNIKYVTRLIKEYYETQVKPKYE